MDLKWQILFLYFILFILSDILGKELSENKINNLPLFHIYTFFEFIIWSWFYKLLLKEQPFFGAGFPIFIAIISFSLIANSLFLEPIFGFNSNAKSLVQIILVSYSIYYLFSTFGKIDFSKSTNQADLLINFGVLLYYSSSLLIFMFMKTLMARNIIEDTRGFWFFNALLNFIFQIFILLAVYKKAYARK